MTISNLVEREEAARLWQAKHEADEALEAARERALTEELEAKFRAEEEGLEARQEAELGITPLREKAEAADEAREAYPAKARIKHIDGTWQVQRCTAVRSSCATTRRSSIG